jgi:hypothetical protein
LALRQAFYINLVIGAVFSPVYVFLLPSFDPKPKATVAERFLMIDWLGIVLCAGALACLVMGIDFGGVQWAWGSGSSIALFVVAGVLLVAFGAQQTFLILCTEKTRLFPVHFLKRRSLVVLFILNSEFDNPLLFLPHYFRKILIMAHRLCKQWTFHFCLLYPSLLPVHKGSSPYKQTTAISNLFFDNRATPRSTHLCVCYHS